MLPVLYSRVLVRLLFSTPTQPQDPRPQGPGYISGCLMQVWSIDPSTRHLVESSKWLASVIVALAPSHDSRFPYHLAIGTDGLAFLAASSFPHASNCKAVKSFLGAEAEWLPHTYNTRGLLRRADYRFTSTKRMSAYISGSEVV